jgi:hypothetical protein
MVSLAMTMASSVVFESGNASYRAEDLLLEDAHLVVAFKQGRLYVIAAAQFAIQLFYLAAAKHLGAFFFAYFQVRLYLLILVITGLGTHHGAVVQGSPILMALVRSITLDMNLS